MVKPVVRFTTSKRKHIHRVKKYLPKTYAIKFHGDDKNKVAGMYLMLLNAQSGCIGLIKEIFLVGENVVKVLDENKIRFKKFRAKPGRVDDIHKEA